MLKTVELESDKIVSVEIVILEHIRPNTRVCQGISYAGRRFFESQPRRRSYSSNRVYKSSNISEDEHLTPPEPRDGRIFPWGEPKLGENVKIRLTKYVFNFSFQMHISGSDNVFFLGAFGAGRGFSSFPLLPLPPGS